MKMLNWKIGIEHGFDITTGHYNKYLKRFLTADEMQRVQGMFPNGEYGDMWDKLFLLYDSFHELEAVVAEHFDLLCDKEETQRVREFLMSRRQLY
jgi:aminoglycoside 6-adenylyltransferase